MIDYVTLIALLHEHGPFEILCHDKSGVRSAVTIPKQPSVRDTVKQLHELKDGVITWEYSIEITPSKRHS